jgi:DNA-binding YbaB/EbfC family protein
MIKGGLQGMMKQVQKMQAEMERVQNELANKQVSEESGGGMVKAVVNGKKELISVLIQDEILNSGDKEMLQDLIVAAVNKALTSAGKLAEEEMAGVTKGMIPPGLNIPGL